MSLALDIPASVTAVLTGLRAAGGQSWLVGGAVRDALLGRVPTDFDIATTLRPAELAESFEGVRPELGFVSIPVEDGHGVTITSLRRDGPYLDQRHPSTVTFVDTPAEDAPRRDFTCNAIYFDPETGAIEDPVAGVADLQARTLRMIGEPRMRLHEDPLRILRAVRFAAATSSRIDEPTAVAMRELASETGTLSRERVFEELTAAFTGPGRGAALRLLVETGVADHVLPEVTAMPGVEQPPEYHPEGDVFVHVCLVLDQVRAGDPIQAWSAVLHDVAKPQTFERAADRIRFSGHDVQSAESADAILRRFRASRELRETVVEIAREHIRFASLPEMKKHKREQFLRASRFEAHLAFHRADCLGSHGKLDIHDWAKAEWEALPPVPPPPLCTGADVLALGVTEGPDVGEALRMLHVQCAEAGVSDRDSALARLAGIVQSHFSDRT